MTAASDLFAKVDIVACEDCQFHIDRVEDADYCVLDEEDLIPFKADDGQWVVGRMSLCPLESALLARTYLGGRKQKHSKVGVRSSELEKIECTVETDSDSSAGERERERRRLKRKCEDALARLELLLEKVGRSTHGTYVGAHIEVERMLRWQRQIQIKLDELNGIVKPQSSERVKAYRVDGIDKFFFGDDLTKSFMDEMLKNFNAGMGREY